MSERPAIPEDDCQRGCPVRQLPEPFGGYAVTRQWIPKALVRRKGMSAARPGKLLARVEKIVIGDTGRRGLTAADAARDPERAYGHFLVDGSAIIECIPALASSVGTVEQACFVRPGAGQAFDAQECAIAVNLCFGGRIRAQDTYARCVALAAFLCYRFRLVGADADIWRAGDLDDARRDPDPALLEAGADFSKLRGAVSAMLKSAAAQVETLPRPGMEVARA